MSYSSQVIADGASAYWRLGEISGTTAVDVVGGFNGTISGGVTYGQPGAISDSNTAMLFDGVNGRVIVPTGSYQTWGTGGATLECWMKQVTTNANGFFFDTKSDGSGNPGLLLRAAGTSALFIVRNAAGGLAQTTATGTAVLGQWQHWVGVLTRGAPDSITLYLNGAVAGTTTLGVSGVDLSSTDGVALGVDTSLQSNAYTNCFLDEVAIYKTALTPTQIANHFAAGAVGRDLTTLLKNHMVVLRAAGGGGALAVDSTTRFTKNIPTMRSGVTVPDCDLPTEIALYVTANG